MVTDGLVLAYSLLNTSFHARASACVCMCVLGVKGKQNAYLMCAVLCMMYNNNECFSISLLQISVYPWP